jgi:hypothetical protein
MARQILTDYDFNSVSRIINLPNATSDQEPATFAQLKSQIEGLAWKDSARVKTQGNIGLSAPGSSIDGISLSSGDRVLVASQSTASQNGIYVWNGAATPATRALDANTFAELEAAVVTVEEGTDAATTWRQSEINGTIDSSTVTWVAFGVAVAAASETTAGKIEIATQAETDTGTDDTRAITPLKLKTWSSAPKRYSTDIGDGSNTSYTVTHNLSTREVTVVVYRNSGNYDEVECEVRHTSTTALTLVFSAAPTSNQFRVVVVG